MTLSSFLKGVFAKPPILAVFFSLLLLTLDVGPGPAPIMKWAGYISGSVSPLALIYCGYIIYELGLKNLRLMRGLPTMIVVPAGGGSGGLLAVLPSVWDERSAHERVHRGERPAGGQPGHRDGGGLWGR